MKNCALWRILKNLIKLLIKKQWNFQEPSKDIGTFLEFLDLKNEASYFA
jgi:hypothetical protein